MVGPSDFSTKRQQSLVHCPSLIFGLPGNSGCPEKGVRHQNPERPFGCFALLVSDTFFRTLAKP
ncbi:hypothetical protein Q31a_63410 [Aureliella helgolandensis]|uniref:Uncharacterized protein n=1 Tax=Aureliella helgolandensis TaxID=2527968 RepID=A0A518GHA7_9BACT|nr:hypothetical protein Q31a_63410 [Aureliella helgolandensis]